MKTSLFRRSAHGPLRPANSDEAAGRVGQDTVLPRRARGQDGILPRRARGQDGILPHFKASLRERKEPIHDAAHVRNAIARFKQVQGVSGSECDAAWKRIQSAAKKHNVELNEQDWRELK